MKIIIQVVLWAVIAFLGWKLFDSIYGEVKFNEVKIERYKAVMSNLLDIRTCELAHKQVTGNFEKDYDKLIRFIDTAQFTITQRRDTSVVDVELTKRYGVDTKKDSVIIDTLGFVSVRDSLFGDTNRYKTMMNIPLEGVTDKIELRTASIEKNNASIPVFEARVAKEVLLYDQKRDYLIKEKQVVSVDAVNGKYISVGSLDQISTKENWPKSYGISSEQ